MIESHTDGMNAVWDNGPVAMISMARYLARLPLDCRRRTIQFAFVTGHLYQRLKRGERDGGAEQVAKRLDREYDRGEGGRRRACSSTSAHASMSTRHGRAVPAGCSSAAAAASSSSP